MITKHHYEVLKKDCGNYQEWLRDEDLNLTCGWFQRNSESHLSDSFAVIQSDFVQVITTFYQSMMNVTGTKNGVERAFDIHSYLVKHHNFIFKQFVFFHINVRKAHCIMSCLCNPWMFVLKQWNNADMPNLTPALKKVSDNKFIHGWLMFDPLKGFILEENQQSSYKKFRDTFVWLANLAYMYHCAAKDKCLNELDFRMHHYLRPRKRKEWEKRFEANPEYWADIKKYDDRPECKTLPHWFEFVVKWFVHGVNGPFGTVSSLSKPFLKAFYHDDVELSKVVWKPVPDFLLPSSKELAFKQDDSVNCGICGLLFMIDLVASQVDNSWEVKGNDASPFPISLQLGSTFFNMNALTDKDAQGDQNVTIKKHLLSLYHAFREELVLLMERLRFLYLENLEDLNRIEIQKGWGKVTDALKNLHKQIEGHIDTARSPDQPQWANKVKKMKDNTLRKQLQGLKYDDETNLTILNFCYAAYESVKKALGISIKSEDNFKIAVYTMYQPILEKSGLKAPPAASSKAPPVASKNTGVEADDDTDDDDSDDSKESVVVPPNAKGDQDNPILLVSSAEILADASYDDLLSGTFNIEQKDGSETESEAQELKEDTDTAKKG